MKVDLQGFYPPSTKLNPKKFYRDSIHFLLSSTIFVGLLSQISFSYHKLKIYIDQIDFGKALQLSIQKNLS